MNRIQKISSHFSAESVAAQGNATSKIGEKADNDPVICCAVRTALGKSGKGSFKDTPPEDLLAALYTAIVERTGINPAEIADAQIGNVACPGGGHAAARYSQFMAKYPASIAAVTVNRLCSSGLQTVANVGASIKAGHYDVAIAGGVEIMSMFPMTSLLDVNKVSDKIFDDEMAPKCLIPMGITSENVAAKFNIPRSKMDAMAVASHNKAEKAQKDGLFDSEIVPVKTVIKDKKTGKQTQVTVSKDEGIRPGMDLKACQKMGPAFKPGGTTTAANSSQTTDGAAMVLVASRSAAKRLNLPILGKMVSFAVKGCDPEIMGIGPAVAIPDALEKAGVTVKDIDIWEVNEAFASQATYCVEKLGIPADKLNPKGGAIALGHPLGCTGSRQIATLFPELKRTGKKLGVVSMCIGMGQGAAAVFEAE